MGKKLRTDPQFDPDKPFVSVTASTDVEEVPQFDPQQDFTPVKKNGKPSVSLESEDGSRVPEYIEPGTDSQKPAEPSKEPGQKDRGVWSPFVDFLKTIKDIPEYAARTAFGTAVDQIPAEFRTEDLRNAKGAMEAAIIPQTSLNSSGFESTVIPPEIKDEYRKWNNSQPASVRFKKDAEKAKMFLQKKFGKEYDAKQAQFNKELVDYRLGIEKDIQQQQEEYAKKIGDAPQDVSQVTQANLGKFIGNLAGQAIGRIPASVLTAGGASIIAERSAVFNEQLDQLSQKFKIPREEVIRRGLDDPESGRILADFLALSDIASLGNVLSGTGKKALQKGLAVAGEAAQETIQGEGEALGGAIGAKTEYKPSASRAITSGLGGLIGSGTVSAILPGEKSAKEVVSESKNQVQSTTDLKGAEKAAEDIQAKVNQVPNEVITQPVASVPPPVISGPTADEQFKQPTEEVPNAVPIGKSETLPVGSPPGDSQTVGQGVSQPEETAGAQVEGTSEEGKGEGGVITTPEGQPQTFYHASPAKTIKSASELKPSHGQQFGKGIYFGSDKETLTDFGDNVFEVQLPNNLLDAGTKEYSQIVNQVEKDTGIDPASDKFPLEKVNDEVKRLGYKGLIMTNDLYGGTEAMVFDAKDIVEVKKEPASAQPKPPKPETKKANRQRMLTDPPTSIRHAVLQFFAGGGKINPTALAEETGMGIQSKRGLRAVRGKIDAKKRQRMLDADAPSIERLAEQLLERLPEEMAEDQDVRNEIIDILMTHETPEAMFEALKEFDTESVEAQQEAYYAAIEAMSDAEATELAGKLITFNGENDIFDEEATAEAFISGEFGQNNEDLVNAFNDAIENLGTEETTTQRGPEENVQGNGGPQAPIPPPSNLPPSGSGLTPDQRNPRQYKIAQRIEASDAKPAIKRGVKEAGDTYIPKALEVTEREAKDLIDLYGDKAEGVVKDITNGLTPDTRTALTAQLYQKYVDAGQNQKAVDIAMWQAEQSMQAGRSVNANKIWKMILSSGEDQIVLAIERQRQQQVQGQLKDIDVSTSRTQLDAEIRRLVEEQVQKAIKERLPRAKLITKEKKQKIASAFDSLKIDTKGGNIVTASVIPGLTLLPHVWNGAVEVMKQAVLTGADIANVIQAGVDYIKANHKGDFDEEKFKAGMEPLIQPMMPKETVEAKDIDESKIKTPKLTGRKKKEFIQEVIQAYNDGTLTDKRFADLYAKKLGVREFTPAEQKQIRELAEIISVAEKFDAELEKNFTPENIKKHKEYVAAAQKANQQLQEFATAPNNIWDTLISIMQGNLMSSMSLVSNVFYNVTYQPLRFTTTGLATMLDYSITKMAKMGLISKSLEDRSIDFVALQKGYFPGGWNGFIEGLKQVKTGTVANERNLREIASGFSPGRAVERWKEKDRTVAQKINDAVEGTIGWEAEAVFRLLNLGDKPWRRAAESARAYELGKLKGLEGEALQKFMLLPDAESKADIERAGLEATFQDSGPVGQKLQQGINNFLRMVSEIPILGGPAKLILKSQLPYVKTPWNLIAETMNYAAPPITMAAGLYQIATGKKRQGTMMVSKAMVGGMIQAAAYQLFLEGLLTGDDDKEKKKRDFQLSGVTPPNSLNVSALERVLAGGSAEQKDNDVWVSYSKMGVMGVLLDNHVNTYKGRVAEGIEGSYISDLLTSGPRIASATLDQTFLQGTSALIEALRGGDEAAQERWLLRTTEALGTILYPNTIATVSKASDEYLRDTQDSKFLDKLENVYKTKVFAGGTLPAKVSIWGEKVTGPPEGRNKYFFYLFDPSKFRRVDTDNFKYKLYKSFKTDYDGEWLPSAPQREISYESTKRKLTAEEYELLSMEVGLSRKALVSGYIDSGSWSSASTEEKKETLTFLYKVGYDDGKKKFMQDLGLNVKNNFQLPVEIRLLKRHLNRLTREMAP